MPLSLNEIKDRSLNFSREWAGETSEQAEAQTFWNEFFHVFGRSRRRLAEFEKNVTTDKRKNGRIDLLWKGNILIEHKSYGADLERAYNQARDYFPGLEDYELPKMIVVCDFQNFNVYDLDENKNYKFKLADLYNNIGIFGFIAGYQKHQYKEEDPVNIHAAELMGKLHDELKDNGYKGHQLEVYLVRLLFCLFADDTGIFEKDTFKEFIEIKTKEDGSDLGAILGQLFEVLNTPDDQRQKSLDEHLNNFPYINGKLFEEHLRTAAFNSTMRILLLECSALNWSKISPAIFGSMFQSVMNPEERRNLGAHYTSEKNILKLIKPLFLDELNNKFEKVKNNITQLKEFHKELSELKFLDPACGCGNFLVITYRELRLLELKILRILQKDQQSFSIDSIVWLDVDQFYGIEYEEWPSKIAEVAMWLMDHQMNMVLSEEFGKYFVRLPLKKSATIVHGNALRLNWEDIISKEELSYILGNPPFYGKQYQSTEQKADMKLVFNGVSGAGVLDYVTAWYIKAARFIQNTTIRVAFVSTNSITKGEQVGVLWNELFSKYNLKIHFAHRTFKWRNEGRENAGVHVVIIGVANYDTKDKYLFEYENIDGEPHQKKVKNINAYLVESNDLIVLKRNLPICEVPEIVFGSMPNDGGHLLFLEQEKNKFLEIEPDAKNLFKLFFGAQEFIYNQPRWCLWLKDVDPDKLRKLKYVQQNIISVKRHRENSSRQTTRNLAQFPYLFGEIRQPSTDYICIPEVSSERRKYIPISILSKNIIAGNKLRIIPKGNFYHLGILTSLMHMIWVDYTCGRLESRYQYSNTIVYNNFPWPNSPSKKNIDKVEKLAQKVLDVREEFPNSSLADLYDPLTMPPKLVKAHNELDKAVDLCYRPQPFPNEMSRIEYLFHLYQQYTEGLFKPEKYKRI